MATLPAHVRVLVLGAGFAGVGAAIRLRRSGRRDVLVLERHAGLGGTWWANTYPGCACDVPSHLYSFSFAPNPAWTRAFSPQPEILRYLEGVVDRFGVRDQIRCGVSVDGARWDGAQRRWQVTTSAGNLTADVVVSATGALSEPLLPRLPGREGFTGEVLHSAAWRPDVDLAGRRVAVVGTGASAVQIVPELAGTAGHVTVFMRTPPWVLPRRDRPIAPAARAAFAALPPLQRLARLGIWAGREAGVPAFVRAPWLMAGVRRLALAHLRHQVADPALRAALTPTFQPGCKRLLLSDDFYPALGRPEVTLVPSAVTGFDGDAVVAADGSRHPVDAVVFATGFAATRMPIAEVVHGRDGATLAQAWRADGMQALRGSTVHGFPNLFLLVGPNTGQGHTSMIYMIESQLNYLVRALDAMDAEPAVAIEPTAVAQRRWNTELARRMRRTVWATGGCASWYQDDHGRVTTLWPASTWTFRRATRRFDPAEYDVVPAELPATDDAGHR